MTAPRRDELADLLRRADALLEMRRFEQAGAVLAAALASAPDDGRALCRLARVHIGLEQWQDAETAARRAVASTPDAEWGHRLLFFALRRQSRSDEALAAAREAARLAPSVPQALQCLTVALVDAGSPHEAVPVANALVRLAPEYAPGHMARGFAYTRLGRRREAEAAYRRAVALDPLCAEARNRLGETLLRTADRREALNCFADAVVLDPSLDAPQRHLRSMVGHWSWAPAALAVLATSPVWLLARWAGLSEIVSSGVALAVAGAPLALFSERVLRFVLTRILRAPRAAQAEVWRMWVRDGTYNAYVVFLIAAIQVLALNQWGGAALAAALLLLRAR